MVQPIIKKVDLLIYWMGVEGMEGKKSLTEALKIFEEGISDDMFEPEETQEERNESNNFWGIQFG